ncbi:MAG: DUF2779 domain-containing protein [Magnetospirillum sp.]|nr:DUF2779 domain-containing protein [Magnetospirillum sp.]
MTGRHLTKSRYLAGLQCLRRLWRLVNDPPDYEDPPAGSPAEAGQEVGRKAHLLFPGGVLVEDEPWQHLEAMARTAALMADASVPAIFEAAFEHAGVRIRADVLERLPGGTWGLREVKSSSGVKDHYIDDLAVQAFVLNGAGVPLSSAQLLHVDTGYVRGADGICWPEFFARVDLDQEVATLLPDTPGRLPALRQCLWAAEPPAAEPGGQCGSPVACEFWDDCTAGKPEDWIRYLPRLSERRRTELAALGIESIAAIPPDFPLSAKQAIIRDATASGKPFVAPDLARLLGRFGPPAQYLDFEAMMPVIPLYAGTRPYQALPFQWSLHTLGADGSLGHREFLAESGVDPRRAFAKTLITALADSDLPIIVYSTYEHSRLKDLAAFFPDLRPALDAIIARLADLLPVVRGAVYHPEFGFSNSIKAVAPALCPGFGYDDLEEVADGAMASAAFVRLASGAIPPGEEVNRLRDALLAYCQRDTLAMVEAHRGLLKLVGRH